MNTMEIYNTLKARGLVPSLRSFSSTFLGKAGNYAADRGLDACSPAALLNLHRRLGEIGQVDLQAAVRGRLLDDPTVSPAGGRP